jgi:ribosome biogenesis protein NSA1
MRLITGDECGLIKESIPELSRVDHESKNEGNSSYEMMNTMSHGVSRIGSLDDCMDRNRGVMKLAFCSSPQDQNNNNNDEDGGRFDFFHFCSIRMNGVVELWEAYAPHTTKEDKICGGSYKKLDDINNIFKTSKCGEKGNLNDGNSHSLGRPVDMCSTQKYQHSVNNKDFVACCSSMGCISIINTREFTKGVKAQYQVFMKPNEVVNISYTRGNFVNRDIATAMTMDFDGSRIAIGGRERSLTMIDTESGKQIWKAKNLPPNPQTLLQQPIWSTAMEFLQPTEDHTNLLANGTAYKQLQIYDVRVDAVQRRPIIYTPEWDSNKRNLLDHRVTSLCQLDNPYHIVVGDTAGYMHVLDMRKITNDHDKKSRSVSANAGRFNGPGGSVRQILKHPTLPIIACVGLDRMLRTFDIKSRKELDCVYLKQRLNCMLFCADDTWGMNANLSKDDEDNYDNYGDEEDDGDIDAVDRVEDYVDSSDEENATSESEINGDGSSDGEVDSENELENDESSDDDSISQDDPSSSSLEDSQNNSNGRPRVSKRRRT